LYRRNVQKENGKNMRDTSKQRDEGETKLGEGEEQKRERR